MKRALVTVGIVLFLLVVAGCERSPTPGEMFRHEFILAGVSFALSFLIVSLGRYTSAHVATHKGPSQRPEATGPGARGIGSSIVIAFFVSLLFLGACVATSTIIKKFAPQEAADEFDAPVLTLTDEQAVDVKRLEEIGVDIDDRETKEYEDPAHDMWGLYVIFTEDIYFALMINAKLPWEAFSEMVLAIAEKKEAEFVEELRAEGVELTPVSLKRISEEKIMTPEEEKNLKLGLSMALTVILFMIPAYVGARGKSRHWMWIIPIVFLAVNVIMNLAFYYGGWYPDLVGMDVQIDVGYDLPGM